MDRAGSASPLQVIRDAMPSLSGAMLRVAELILEAPEQAGRESITKLADRARTSPATVTRLSTLLGFDGYPAFRAAIATEHGRDVQAGWEGDIGAEITPDDPPGEVLNVLASNQARALRNALGSVDVESAERAADRIAAASRIHIYGEWGDAIPARELYIRLLRIGVPVWFHEDGETIRNISGLLNGSSVALVVSRAGDNATAHEFVDLAAQRGATSVAITGAPELSLARTADIALFTGTRNGTTWTEYFAGRASDALTCGLLWMLVAQRVSDTVAAVFETRYGPGTPRP